MKILLLSDTHSYIDDAILAHAREADEVWHAGDIGDFTVMEQLQAVAPVRAVYGNIDEAQLRREVPLDLYWNAGDVNVYMTHIGGYPGRYTKRVRQNLDARPQTDLYICGHSHILKVMPDRKRGLLHMNPGACGTHGFHRVRTMLRFQVKAGRVSQVEVIELGLRGALSS